VSPPAPLEPPRLSRESFERFATYITKELGIKMPDSKLTMVQSRLYSRVRELQLDSVEQYGEYFFADGSAAEREKFVDAVTTNKTDFFREAEHFDYLVGQALPALQAGPVPGRLNVWSAGCSSGEEPYTLAIVLAEVALKRPGFSYAILGTDVSNRVLKRAREAIYDEQLVGPVAPALRHKYLMKSKDRARPQVRIVPALREKTSFHRLNFMNRQYRIRDPFDVVFFRNVLIYFDRRTQELVINRICQHLKPGGYLFIGHAESLAGMDVPVESVHTSVFRKPAA